MFQKNKIPYKEMKKNKKLDEFLEEEDEQTKEGKD